MYMASRRSSQLFYPMESQDAAVRRADGARGARQRWKEAEAAEGTE